jgi:hypothetical protein
MKLKIIPNETPAKVESETGTAKVVKTYRIEEDLFDKADALSRQKHGVGLSSLIGPLVKAYFKLDKDKK